MKVKALAIALAAGIALPAFADVTNFAGINTKNDDITAEVGVKTNGFTVKGEYILDKANNQSKEFTATVQYRYDINDSFYLEPVASYTKELRNKDFGSARDGFEFRKADTTKVGLKGGWNSDFGLYAAARYRYEMGGSESQDMAAIEDTSGKKEKRIVHRTDLTIGYHFDVITAQYNIWRKEANKDQFHMADGKKTGIGHDIKFSYTGFDKFTPFVEFNFEEKKRNAGTAANPDYKSKNSAKLGVAFTF